MYILDSDCDCSSTTPSTSSSTAFTTPTPATSSSSGSTATVIRSVAVGSTRVRGHNSIGKAVRRSSRSPVGVCGWKETKSHFTCFYFQSLPLLNKLSNIVVLFIILKSKIFLAISVKVSFNKQCSIS